MLFRSLLMLKLFDMDLTLIATIGILLCRMPTRLTPGCAND